MKYMRWRDLEPGDVLQFTDEYLSIYDGQVIKKYKNKNMVISKIIYEKDCIKIYSDLKWFHIEHNGFDFHRIIYIFKLVELRKEQ